MKYGADIDVISVLNVNVGIDFPFRQFNAEFKKWYTDLIHG